MEVWQISHVRKKLPKLLSWTNCSTLLLAELQAQDLLGEDDVQAIEVTREPNRKADLLYKILEGRKNSYYVLLKALIETKQTGAAKVLLEIPAEKLGELEVWFMGNTNKVKNLLGEDQIRAIYSWLQKNISLEEHMKIHENVFQQNTPLHLLRGTIPEPYSLYIPRLLYRNLILNPEVFKNESSDVFVIKNATRQILRNFVSKYAIESSTSQLLKDKISARFILLDVEIDWQRVCDKLNVPVHLISYERLTDTFIVEATSGGSELLRKYLTTQHACENVLVSEDEFVESLLDEKIKGICICDSPGMGKSFLLANIARKLNAKCSDRVVIFFPLRNLDLLEKPIEYKCTPIEPFLVHVSTSVLASRILIEMTKNNCLKVEIFFDGLDEVDEAELEHVTSYLQTILGSSSNTRIFVTSRPVVLAQLEKSVGVIAYNIQPFNLETQVRFLVSYWTEKEPSSKVKKLQEYAEFCLMEIKKLLKEKENIIAGVPLQCRLIAEVYGKSAIVYADQHREISLQLSENFVNSLSKIYQKYMIGQLGETKCQFDCMTKIDSAGNQCDISCKVKSFHAWHALQLIFPDIAMQLSSYVTNFEGLSLKHITQSGVLEKSQYNNGDFEFLHRTFAEYLVAEYLSMTLFADTKTNKCRKRNYSRLIEKLAFDSLFFPGEERKDWFGREVLKYHTLREGVVAYFLNDTITNTGGNKLECLCTERILPLESRFFATLEACLQADIEELLNVLLKCASNSRQKDYKMESKDKLCNVLSVAAAFCSKKAIHEIFKFLQNVLMVDIMKLGEQGDMSKTMHIVVWRADYEVVQDFVDRIPVERMGLLHICVEETRYLDKERIEKRIDVAQLLLSKCEGLIQEAWEYNNAKECKSPLLANNIHLRAIKFLVENGVEIQAVDYDGRTVFNRAIEYMEDIDLLNLAHFLFVKGNAQNLILDPTICKLHLHGILHTKRESRLRLRIIMYLMSMTELDPKNESMVWRSLKTKTQAEQNLVESLSGIISPALYQKFKQVFECIFIDAVNYGEKKIVLFLIDFDYSLIEMEATYIQYAGTPLLLALRNYNLEMFTLLLFKGANPYAIDSSYNTVLHLAAVTSSAITLHEVIRLLGGLCFNPQATLQKLNIPIHEESKNSKISPKNITELLNWPGFNGRTPLHFAVMYISNLPLDTLDLLLVCGSKSEIISSQGISVNISAVDNSGVTALHLALKKKQRLELIKHLVQRDADWTIKSSHACKAIILSAGGGLMEHFKYFVKLGCEVNSSDENGNTPLLEALTEKQNLDFVKYLISLGAECSAKNNRGVNVAQICSTNGLLDHLKYFVELGCDVDTADIHGRTPLLLALHGRQSMGFIRYLASLRVNCFVNGDDGYNAIHICAMHGLLEHMDYFINLGCDLNAVSRYGDTPLLVALRNKQSLHFAKYMVNRGAECLARNDEGRSVMHLCASNGLREHFKYFLGLGCDANSQDDDGNTPLHTAVLKKQNIEFVKYMVSLGANCAAVNENGTNVIQMCAANGLLEHLIFFAELGCKVNTTDEDGWTPLLTALLNGRSIELVKTLVASGGDWLLTNNKECNITVVHICAQEGLREHLNYFVEIGCNVNVADKKGDTPLFSALCARQSLDFVKHLVRLKADFFAKNNLGKNATHICASKGLFEHLQYFLELGCKVNDIDNDGNSPLLLSLCWPHTCKLDFVKYLVNTGADWSARNNQGMNAVHICAQEGLFEHLQYFLEIGLELNDTNHDGNTPLLLAVFKRRNLEFLKQLVSICADTSVRNNLGQNAAHIAAKVGHLENVKYFLDLGCAINATDNNGNTPLLLALRQRIVLQFIKDLVAIGADLSAQDNHGLNSVHICACKGLLKHLDYLAELGYDMNVYDHNGNTPIHLALVARQDIDVVQALVRHGADWSVTTKSGVSALHICAGKGLFEHLKYFVELGFEVNATDQAGWTPLHIATAEKQSLELVKYLVSVGADCLVKCNQGISVAHLCAHKGLLEHLTYFAELGCDLNAVNQKGNTPLLSALGESQSLEFIKYVVSLGADCTVHDNHDRNATHICALKGLLEHLRYFVDLGCDVNIGDQEGNTPLIYAVWSKQSIEFVKYLVEIGANVSAQNNQGMNVTHCCAYCGLVNQLQYFVELGCEVNATDYDGNTPLLYAVQSGQSIDFAKYLISVGADWSVKNNHGTNAVLLCASFGHPELLKYFLELGCDCNVIDGDGDNALQSVVHDYKSSEVVLLEIVDMLISAGVSKTNENKEGKTAYDYAVEKGHPSEVLSRLL